MLEDMMGKLGDMQQRMEEAKKKLDAILVNAEAGGGAVKVTITANKEIKNITISEELHKGDREELEELLTVAMNRALAEAEKVHESEMRNTASGMLPGMEGLF
jgi:DNA-binding YbaB/EbfC family protein